MESRESRRRGRMAEEKRKISAPSICAHGMGLSLDVPAICIQRKRGLSFRGLGLAYSARKATFLGALRENDGVIKLWFRIERERKIFRTSLLIDVEDMRECACASHQGNIEGTCDKFISSCSHRRERRTWLFSSDLFFDSVTIRESSIPQRSHSRLFANQNTSGTRQISRYQFYDAFSILLVRRLFERNVCVLDREVLTY